MNSFYHRLRIPVLGLLITWSCTGPDPDTLRIACASSMQYVMEDLEAAFVKETSIKTHIILGSSGKLTTQVLQGAPIDILLSADTTYPSRIFENGKGISRPQEFASGKLVLWSTVHNDLSLKDLENERFEKIAMANPELAPYGLAARSLLETLYLDLEEQLVYGESIGQTNHFISSGNVDAGFTSMSTVLSSKMKDVGSWIEIPDTLYVDIRQALIVIRDRPNQDKAEQFLNFLLGAKGREILERHGYIVP